MTELPEEQLQEIENDINDIEDYDYSDSTKKIMNKIRKLTAQVITQERERIRATIRNLEIREKQRYLSESGFWASREVISRPEVMDALNPKKGE